jgi:2-phospho-L-lactate guanylyltransferase
MLTTNITEVTYLQLNGDQEDQLWALVPVKLLTRSKQRLKSCVGADRPGLTIAMLKDVLDALIRSREITRIAVVTADPLVSSIADSRGALVIDEAEANGMNEALELGMETIGRMGGRLLVIVPADIPLITGSEIDRVMHDMQVQRQARGENVTGIGPSKDRGGTNFFCLDTRRPLPLMYGPDSYRRHRECAVEHGNQPITLHSAAISLDIDEQKDLDEFITFCLSNSEYQKTKSWQFLLEKGYINHAGQSGVVHGNEQSGSSPTKI